MKKVLSLILIVVLSLSLLAGCSKKESADNEIKIGVSPVPHRELINLIKEDLENEGLKVTVIEFTDYVKPNHALADKEIDANFFQHEPYLNDFKEKEKLDIISLGKVHIEPMGFYSSKINSIDELKDGSEILIPNDTVNGGRALLLLESNGLIKLKDGAGLEATEKDIVENPKNLKVKSLEAGSLPRVLKDVDGAVINGNYALDAGLNPVKDSLFIEGKDSPYANLVAIRAGEENKEKFVKLLKALQSEKVKKYIEDTYGGAIIPAF
ncbi:MetQ/NlpA family ABC transporter substrate-binding protein [Tissierella sp. MSJ-40]|uniref:Lipoprotein n=1 Tax=Tissierella simiarum TaxID=2841534 RepID=A0ABS6E6J2_9FIRM|nr:MetQ/NlpA family ABC transporter substrate-binding protein [Tissierella simiarum]MBU5438527.1 MetQ/NlpA family ABC transporter substrate-binding protein [Tissierella simiarum]